MVDPVWDRNPDDTLLNEEDDLPARFRNFYECPDCGVTWDTEWSCQCNDHCPSCDLGDILPYKSEDL